MPSPSSRQLLRRSSRSSSPPVLHVARRGRRGVTLLELLVALVLMGIVASVAMPAFSPAPRRGAVLADVVRAARGAAIARAQVLALTVADDGRWGVHPLAPDDSLSILDGTLDSAPSAAFRLQLTPLGACLAASPLPAELRGWDAAGCTPANADRRGE